MTNFWPLFPERVRMWSPWWLRHVLAVERESHDRTRREYARAEDALHSTLVCIQAHERWCGYNPDAPGDSIINDAPRKARIALHQPPGDGPRAASALDENQRPTKDGA